MSSPRRVSLTLLASLALALAACGGDDDAGAADAGSPDADLPAFHDAVEGTWTWVDVPGNQCMNGSATGIGINLNRASDKLAIVFEGGGACFNDLSCFDVAHKNGYREADLATFAGTQGQQGLFDRTDASNPIRDWNIVMVPYCSGDVHIGNAEQGVGGRTQVGFQNTRRTAELVAAEFDGDLSQVLVTGMSAGGFGSAFNFDQIQQIFGDVPADLLDDSGPPLGNATLTPCLQQQIRTVWNVDSIIPTDCPQCISTGLSEMIPFLAGKYPQQRFGYISSLRDATIERFFGFGYPDCDNPSVPMADAPFQAGIEDMRDHIVSPLANAAMFSLDSSVHVWTWGKPLEEVQVGSVDLGTWMGELVDHADGWGNITPPITKPAN
jgi:hypothetical protein